MRFVGPIFFLIPLAGSLCGLAWTLWRSLAFAHSHEAPGEIVGWKAVPYEADFDKPAFERYVPIVRYRSHDGVSRLVEFHYPYDSPKWNVGLEPTVYYTLWPRCIAAEGPWGFYGPPIVLLGFSIAALIVELLFMIDKSDWEALDELTRWLIGGRL